MVVFQSSENKEWVTNYTWTLNFLASIGDFVQIIYDWLFFEQYLAASLSLPIALNMDIDEKDLHVQRKRVQRIRLLVNVGFYVSVGSWFTISVYFGKMLVRFMVCLIYSLIVIIYLYSLIVIKSQLAKLESASKTKVRQNKCLLHGYFILFVCELCLYFSFFVITLTNREIFSYKILDH